jgi:hypothetical protein
LPIVPRTFALEPFMIARRNPDTEAAEQYLTWALEEIEKLGHPKAAFHARIALEELGSVHRSANKTDERAIMYAQEARRFRDKADEAKQLVELAETAARRDALAKIVESHRRTAEQMDRLSDAYNNRRKAE